MAVWSIWNQAPSPAATADTANTELGLQFKVNQAGCSLTAYWFWLPSGCDTTGSRYSYRLYSTTNGTSGTLITGTSVTDSGTLTAGAWRRVPITPVALTSGTTYVATQQYAGAGSGNHYGSTANYWSSGAGGSGITSGPISAPNAATALGGNQNPFNEPSTGGMPVSVFNASAYYVDVEIDDGVTSAPDTEWPKRRWRTLGRSRRPPFLPPYGRRQRPFPADMDTGGGTPPVYLIAPYYTSAVSQTSYPVTVTTPTQAGDGIVVSAGQSGANPIATSCTDSRGNGYTMQLQTVAGAAGPCLTTFTASTPVTPLQAGDTVTVTFSAANTQSKAIYLLGVTGCPYADTAAMATLHGSSTAPSQASGTLAGAPETLVGVINNTSAGGAPTGVTAGWAAADVAQQAPASLWTQPFYQVAASTSPVTLAATISASTGWDVSVLPMTATVPGTSSISPDDAGAAVDDAAGAFTTSAAVPVADLAAGVESLTIAAAVPLPDVGGAAETVAVSAAVPVADRAAGVETVSVTASVPLAEVGAATETAAVAVTVPLPEVAAGAEVLTVPAETLPLPDAGAAAEAVSVAVTLPLAETGAGAEGISATATLSLSDQGGAAEAQVSGMPVSYAEAAGAADQVATTVVTGLAETGAAIDSQAVSAAVTLADAGGSADQATVSAAIPLADAAAAAESQLIGVAPVEAAAAADALAVSVSLAVADVAGGADAISVSQGQPVSLADAAAATESSAAAASVPVGEAAGSIDAVAASAAVPLPEQAGAADAISVAAGAAPQLPDAAGGREQLATAVTVPLGDSAAGADTVGVSASALLADAGAASEGWGTSANVPTADAAAAADALSVVQTAQPVLADAAGVTEAYSAAVTTPGHDVAAASDALVTGVLQTVQLADVGSAADVLVYSIPPTEPRPIWTAAPAGCRWHTVPADPRWQVAGAGTRWETSPSPPRWEAQAMPARWVILVAEFEPIASVSQEMINLSWTSDLGGSDVDPTTGPMPVRYAFPASSGDQHHPAAPVTWFPGVWLPDTGSYKGYISQCGIGPLALGGLVQLAPGSYDVWGEVTTGTETVRKFAGVQVVY